MCLYQKLGGLSRMWQAHVSGSIIEEQPFFPLPEFAMCLSDSEDGYYYGILHLSEKSSRHSSRATTWSGIYASLLWTSDYILQQAKKFNIELLNGRICIRV